MFRRMCILIASVIVVLLTSSAVQPVTAETTPPDLTASLCDPGPTGEYARWVTDMPCMQLSAAALEQIRTQQPLLDSIEGDAPENTNSAPEYMAPYTEFVYASYRDMDWEIYGKKAPWGDTGVENSIRMTDYPGSDIMPRLRPGGDQVLFSSNRDGDYDLYLMEWGGGNVQQLTFDPAYDSQSYWSPDGTHIVFVSNRDGNMDLYTMLPDGSMVTRLTLSEQNDVHPSWSGDGTRIFWVRVVDAENGEIFSMDVDGSNQQSLTQPIRFLQHPTQSRFSSTLLLDYDSNGDGWMDLGLLNLTHGNLVRIVGGTELMDFVAGNNTDIFEYYYLGSKIEYILYNNTLYILSMCNGTELQGGLPCFKGSNLDYYPNSALNDITIPESHVVPLPEFSRVGALPVVAVGSDPGPADLVDISVQYRLGESGDWLDLNGRFFGTYDGLDAWNGTYTGAPGTVYFRSQGKDSIWNLEPYPAGNGDAYSNVYTWELSGRISDTREIHLPNVGIIASPGFNDQLATNSTGWFHRYMPEENITLAITKPGYENLPEIIIHDQQEDMSDSWMLRAPDNLIVNGDFELDLSSGWIDQGVSPAHIQTEFTHNGISSLQLGGLVRIAEPEPLTTGNTWAERPKAIIDQNGDSYVTWIDNGKLLFISESISGTWTAPVEITPPAASDVSGHRLLVGNGSNLYEAWLEYDDADIYQYNLYLSEYDPFEGWSSPEFITVTADQMYSYPEPYILVDPDNTVHLFYTEWGALQYLNKPESGDWSAAIQLPAGFEPFDVDMTPDGTIHLISADTNFYYVQRGVEGTWSEPISQTLGIAASNVSDLEILCEPNGAIHVVASLITSDYDNGNSWRTLYYLSLENGQWSLPVPINDLQTTVPITFQIVRGDQGLRVFWWNDKSLYSNLILSPNQIGPVIQIVRDESVYLYGGGSITQKGDDFQGFWVRENSQLTRQLITTKWELPQIMTSSASQQVTIPAQMHNPTLSFQYLTQQGGAGGEFAVQINAAQVFSTSAATAGWEHVWLDLAPWAGQTITMTFQAGYDQTQGYLYAYLDDVSLGSWLTPWVEQVAPWQVEPLAPALLTLTGENFSPGMQVLFNGIEQAEVTFIDEHTLIVNLPQGLPAGRYDIWVVDANGRESISRHAVQSGAPLFLPVTRR